MLSVATDRPNHAIMNLACPIPVLRSFDEQKALEFYIGFLEFSVDWQHRFVPTAPLYMQVSQGSCVIHLSEHYGDCTPGAALRVATDDLQALRQRLVEKDNPNALPAITEQSWGSDMSISDPFGNRLIFCQLKD